jgi:enamine deaminase RidA (YjgF/YER057c/UK114 family)
MKTTRRSAALAVLSGAALSAQPNPQKGIAAKKAFNRRQPAADGKAPLFSEAVSGNGFIFVSGHGVNDVQGVAAQTKKTLDNIQSILENAGSSM